MDATEIILGKKRHKISTNEDNFIGVELQSYEKTLSYTEDSYYIDSYQRYYKEKDESQRHRMAFTITPFCSNVLFNVLSEPVYMEGSDSAITITKDDKVIPNFNGYKSGAINREKLIEDTGYSHPYTSASQYPIVYHCGLDIFNNHLLRNKEFAVVNITSGTTRDEEFNTIKDYARDGSGKTITEEILYVSPDNGQVNTTATDIHLYQYGTIMSYEDSITNNLIESNGWFGFLNATTLPIDNVTIGSKKFSINKCMNNNKAWEQIDMYPDRSLFSFAPKLNKFRGRVEKNWDYCLTYPVSADTENDLINGGLKCRIYFPNVDEWGDSLLNMENATITLKSAIRHNLAAGEYVNLYGASDAIMGQKTANPAQIVSVGLNGKDKEHYF